MLEFKLQLCWNCRIYFRPEPRPAPLRRWPTEGRRLQQCDTSIVSASLFLVAIWHSFLYERHAAVPGTRSAEQWMLRGAVLRGILHCWISACRDFPRKIGIGL